MGLPRAAGELNLLDNDLEADTKVRHSWSPGSLKYYGRAELQASDHRCGPRCRDPGETGTPGHGSGAAQAAGGVWSQELWGQGVRLARRG